MRPSASDIGRHEVRGKLNAREIQMQRGPQTLDQERLAETRNALQEGMATTQEADEESFHYVSMAHDDFSNLRAYTLKIFTELGYLRLNIGHFIIPSDKKYCLICSR